MMEEQANRSVDHPEVLPRATDGLGRFDRDRALSLADEGGVSAAGLESQDSGEPAGGRSPGALVRTVVICGLVAAAIWGLRRALVRPRVGRGF
jgi:hypothetical protein